MHCLGDMRRSRIHRDKDICIAQQNRNLRKGEGPRQNMVFIQCCLLRNLHEKAPILRTADQIDRPCSLRLGKVMNQGGCCLRAETAPPDSAAGTQDKTAPVSEPQGLTLFAK